MSRRSRAAARSARLGRGRVGPVLVAAVLLGAGLAALRLGPGAPRAEAEPAGYRHNRADYRAFQERFPELLEPNYLPFMVTRVARPEPPGIVARLRRWLGQAPPPTDLLVFCRWDEADFPLAVYIQPPEIGELPEELLDPPTPESFVEAAARALSIWEQDLEGRIGFRRVEQAAEADLTVRLIGGTAPEHSPEVQVLGTTALGEACRVVGGDPDSGRLDVRFRVPELRIYVADQHGLLLPVQVERVAIHEIGHALGMYGHSPIPADLMYEVARDRLGPDGLGVEDVNSFLSLYSIPNGAVYADPAAARLATPPPPIGPPRFELAPHVDAGRGFEVQIPEGWLRIPTQYGVVAVNGVAWDYDASIQVIVRRFQTVDEYLSRYGQAHLSDNQVLRMGRDEVAGAVAARASLHTRHGTREELVFIETGDGRLILVIAECPVEAQEAYLPWFEGVLDSLEIVAGGGRGDRDYSAGQTP